MREVERQRNREREGRNRREGRRERREAEYQMRCVVHRCCCNTILHSIPSDGEPAWPGGGGETDGVEGLEDSWQLVGQQLGIQKTVKQVLSINAEMLVYSNSDTCWSQE